MNKRLAAIVMASLLLVGRSEAADFNITISAGSIAHKPFVHRIRYPELPSPNFTRFVFSKSGCQLPLPPRDDEPVGTLEEWGNIQVNDPSDPGTTLTDIDCVIGNTLWEQKSANFADDVTGWVNKNITEKIDRFSRVITLIQGLSDDPAGRASMGPLINYPAPSVGVQFILDPLDTSDPQVAADVAAFTSAVENAVSNARRLYSWQFVLKPVRWDAR